MIESLSGTFSCLSATLWLAPISAFAYEFSKFTPCQRSSAIALSELEVNMANSVCYKGFVYKGSCNNQWVWHYYFLVLIMQG